MNSCLLFGAPMAGITDKPFRQMCRKFTDLPLYTEMVGVNSFVRGSSATKRMMDLAQEKNIIVQLVGIEKEALVYTAKAAQNAGAIGVDINMGCPVRKLITNGSGAALMKNTALAASLVEAVATAVNIPVSVKTRLGWAQKDDVLLFAKALAEAGAKRIAVHARTKEQGFSGEAEWQCVKPLTEHLTGVEIIINGDIADKTSYEAAMAQSGACGAMIGRALWGKPWLFYQIETGLVPDYSIESLVLEHFEQMLDFYGRAGFYAARKHLARYAKGYEGHALFCEKMFQEETETGVKTLIRRFFGVKTIKEKL